jgi:ArsR family metal-binding transcriptional regulator
MSNIWVKTWMRTPKINCGLCGRAVCTGFARALVVGQLNLDDCPILGLRDYGNLRAELEAMTKGDSTPRSGIAPELPEGGVLFTQPCKDTNDRVMAELSLHNGVEPGESMRFSVFDPQTLCDLMNCLQSQFDLVKCSHDLGYGRADVDEMNITVLQDGRINMRRVKDRDQVMSVFGKLERALVGATICNCCGCDLLSILSGCVEPVDVDRHTVYDAGTNMSIDEKSAQLPIRRADVESAFGENGERVLSLIQNLADNLEAGMVQLLDGSIELLITNPSLYGNETLLLKVLALVRVVFDALCGVSELAEILVFTPKEDHDAILKLVSMAQSGELSLQMKAIDDQRRILAYAHSLRLNRAVRLLQEWVR